MKSWKLFSFQKHVGFLANQFYYLFLFILHLLTLASVSHHALAFGVWWSPKRSCRFPSLRLLFQESQLDDNNIIVKTLPVKIKLTRMFMATNHYTSNTFPLSYSYSYTSILWTTFHCSIKFVFSNLHFVQINLFFLRLFKSIIIY